MGRLVLTKIQAACSNRRVTVAAVTEQDPVMSVLSRWYIFNDCGVSVMQRTKTMWRALLPAMLGGLNAIPELQEPFTPWQQAQENVYTSSGSTGDTTYTLAFEDYKLSVTRSKRKQ